MPNRPAAHAEDGDLGDEVVPFKSKPYAIRLFQVNIQLILFDGLIGQPGLRLP